jgi:DNA polymerase I-like protein with 3'-5' exonuclease and polymerase domains
MSLNFKDPGKLTTREIYYEYAMPLQRAFIDINERGVRVEQASLDVLRSRVNADIAATVQRISALLRKPVVASGTKLPPDTLNLASPQQILEALKALGMKPPKKRRYDGQWTESTDEESLNELFAKTGHPFLKELLRIRELAKLLSTYINVSIERDTLYGSFVVPGTVTGRRSCRENFLGLGTNLQNQPKHGDLAKTYRACLVARPGKIFVKCDQVSAEDWIVQGIICDQSGDRRSLDDLRSGTDRHAKLAAQIFNKPIERCGKDTPERYLGKRIRHAGNYDMEAFRFAEVMAAEGHHFTVPMCEVLLARFHAAEPGIKQVFHKYVQNEMISSRCLTNPFGFTRQFFALRDHSDNRKLFKEGYSQIPQGTVGINTGMAILWLERYHPGYVVLDEHDAITLEVPDALPDIEQAIAWLRESFDRIIRLPNGLELMIPIETEIGYDLAHMKTCVSSSNHGVMHTYNGLVKPPNLQKPGTSGQQPASSQEPVAEMSG